MKQITIVKDIIYYNILGELVFFKLHSKQYNKWLEKTRKQKIQSLRDRGLLT